MIYHSDFRDLFYWLNETKVDYLIVGGFAVAFHGAPRFTGDMDVLVRPDGKHVQRMLSALDRFGFSGRSVTPKYLLSRGKILQLGNVPVQVHIMTSITGVSWEDAWESREAGSYGGVPVLFIGLTALLKNKTGGRASEGLGGFSGAPEKSIAVINPHWRRRWMAMLTASRAPQSPKPLVTWRFCRTKCLF